MLSIPTPRHRRSLALAMLAWLGCLSAAAVVAGPALENDALSLAFDDRGRLVELRNKLTGESFAVAGDDLAIEGVGFTITADAATVEPVEREAGALRVRGRSGDARWTTVWTLHPGRNYAEKSVTITFDRDCGLERVVLGRPAIRGPGQEIVAYRHPDPQWVLDFMVVRHGVRIDRPANSQPSTTFFGRTPQGGWFTGVEMAFDASRLEDDRITFAFAPHARMKAGREFACPPVYVGVVKRSPDDARADEWRPATGAELLGKAAVPRKGGVPHLTEPTVKAGQSAAAAPAAVRPLPSESRAMVAMTSAILGPPRHGLKAMACAWHCQMDQDEYTTDEELEKDLKALEFIDSCGLDGVWESHPWGGDWRALAALREGERFAIGPRSRRFLERARELGLTVVLWPTMNTSHPWNPATKPFRLDKPEWIRGTDGEPLPGTGVSPAGFRRRHANCLANEPFANWLRGVLFDDTLGTGLYQGWVMDGDFWGSPAFIDTILPVTCLAEGHDHLPGDSNDACQRRLADIIAEVRRRHPGMYITMCRPPMDLGVWAMRHVDACFTLVESGGRDDNVSYADEVRTAARIRLHEHFFPHWLDMGLLFPSYGQPGPTPPWPSAKIDYAMISALSCAPNLLLYLPARDGIPEADRLEIRKWLDWGRANEKYLMVRRDLFDWPGKGRVDGSAHVVDGKGIVFLFNGTEKELTGEVPLDGSIGLDGAGRYTIVQEYPPADRKVTAQGGETVRWTVPPRTAVILRIEP